MDREHLLAALMTGFKEGGDFDITEVTLPADMKWCKEGDSEYPGNEVTPIKGQGCWVITKNNNKFYVDEYGTILDDKPKELISFNEAYEKGWVGMEVEGKMIVTYGGKDSNLKLR